MHPARHCFGKVLAASLIAAHLLVIGMAVSPALHHWLHDDCGDPDHHCAATAMIDGQIDLPAAASACVVVAPFLAEVCEPDHAAIPPAPTRLLPGERAPPRA